MSDISMAADFSDGQAHGMSHPMAQAEGVQHVSDAAWLTYEATFPGLEGHRAEVEADQVIAGAVLRTVGEWRDLTMRLDATRKLLAGMIEQSVELRGEIAELRKQLREVNDVRRLAGSSSAHSGVGADSVGGMGRTLTLLPEPDARLGRGNAAMDAHE